MRRMSRLRPIVVLPLFLSVAGCERGVPIAAKPLATGSRYCKEHHALYRAGGVLFCADPQLQFASRITYSLGGNAATTFAEQVATSSPSPAASPGVLRRAGGRAIQDHDRQQDRAAAAVRRDGVRREFGDLSIRSRRRAHRLRQHPHGKRHPRTWWGIGYKTAFGAWSGWQSRNRWRWSRRPTLAATRRRHPRIRSPMAHAIARRSLFSSRRTAFSSVRRKHASGRRSFAMP